MKKAELEDLTLSYWRVSRAWNGHNDKDTTAITTAKGISVTNNIIASTGPQRKLNHRALELGSSIINNDSVSSNEAG